MISIGSNISSLVVQRNLARVTTERGASSERLASGQRINSASDDAAGLAITSTLKKDRALSKMAMRNISDGISMINIAGAALTAQQEILFRMAELAEQSANGTYSRQQRSVLQNEYATLMDEFDRIGEATEFNGMKLLRNRSGSGIQLMAGISGEATSVLEIAALNNHRYAGVLTQKSDLNHSGNVDILDLTVLSGSSSNDPTISTYETLGNGGLTRTEMQDAAVIRFVNSTGTSGTFNFSIYRLTGDLGTFTKNYTGGSETITALANRQDLWGTAVLATGESATLNVQLTTSSTMPLPQSYTANLTFATSGTTASIHLDLSGLTFESFDKSQAAYTPSAIGFTNILNAYTARRAVNVVRNRIDLVSQSAGLLGAFEARLRVAHSVVSTGEENYAAAASRIGDADVAAESANLLRTSILQQVASAILGQANTAPQIALNLLQAA